MELINNRAKRGKFLEKIEDRKKKCDKMEKINNRAKRGSQILEKINNRAKRGNFLEKIENRAKNVIIWKNSTPREAR